MKPVINSQKVFAGFRRVFGVSSYASVPKLAGFDSGHVSRMRSGKVRISHSFFLSCCLAAGMTPLDMCAAIGIPEDYFLPM